MRSVTTANWQFASSRANAGGGASSRLPIAEAGSRRLSAKSPLRPLCQHKRIGNRFRADNLPPNRRRSWGTNRRRRQSVRRRSFYDLVAGGRIERCPRSWSLTTKKTCCTPSSGLCARTNCGLSRPRRGVRESARSSVRSPMPCCSTCGSPICRDSTCSRSCAQIDPKLPVIVMTTHGTAETAIEAMQRGAFDYLLKPWNLDELTDLVESSPRSRPAKPRASPHRSRRGIRRPRRPRHRPFAGNAERLQGDRPHRRAKRECADPGRERDRKGTRRAGDLRPQSPQ